MNHPPSDIAYLIPDAAAISAQSRRTVATFAFPLLLCHSCIYFAYHFGVASGRITTPPWPNFEAFDFAFFLYFLPLCHVALAITIYSLLRTGKGLALLRVLLVILIAGLVGNVIMQQIIWYPTHDHAMMGSTFAHYRDELSNRLLVAELSLKLLAWPALLWASIAFLPKTTAQISRRHNLWLAAVALLGLLPLLPMALNSRSVQMHITFLLTGRYSPHNTLHYLANGLTPIIPAAALVASIAAIFALAKIKRARRIVMTSCLLICAIVTFSLIADCIQIALKLRDGFSSLSFPALLATHLEIPLGDALLRFALNASPALATYLFLALPAYPQKTPHANSPAPLIPESPSDTSSASSPPSH